MVEEHSDLFRFDEEWYQKTYPDVAGSKLSPYDHYSIYGHRLGRKPNLDFVTEFFRLGLDIPDNTEPIAFMKETKNYAPSFHRILWAISEGNRRLSFDKAIELSYAYLPKRLHYTINVLHANEALKHGNTEDWLHYINEYIHKYKITDVCLLGAGSVFDRLSCAHSPTIANGPLISVIMPAYNAEKTIVSSINSILRQTWRNLELIVIDDASTDGTWSVLNEIAKTDDRLRISRNKLNVGPYVSKNIALRYAEGKWITGHDADDWAHPQRLEQHLKFAVKSKSDASYSYMLRMSPDGFVDRFSKIGDFSIDGVARVSLVSTLFQADLLKNRLGAWDSVRFGADSEMVSRTQKLIGTNFKKFETIGMFCLDLSSSLTNDPEHGINTPTGLSATRADYKKRWSKAHQAYQSNDFYMDFPILTHAFQSPSHHFVPIADVSTVDSMSLNQRTSNSGNRSETRIS